MHMTKEIDSSFWCRKWSTWMALLLFSFMLSGCTAKLPMQNLVGPKTYRETVDIKVNGFKRTFRVHVPAGYTPEKNYPLVVIVHGAFDTAAGMEKVSGFSELADREGFVALYPNGMGRFGFLQHWNAGHCCGKAAEIQLDDVGYIDTTIDEVCRRIAIDHSRIYMVGFSNGGMLTYRFAAEKSDRIAAAAPLAASIGGKSSAEVPEWYISEPSNPVPVIVFHGMSDDDIRFEGGVSLHRGETRTYWSVDRSIGFWVSSNGCAGETKNRNLNHGNIIFKRWTGCTDDAEVVLYLLKDWGHVWPGKYFTGRLPSDHPFKDFDAAEIIWEFFKTKKRK